ncbi:hypothetical protein B0H10DRAFT_661460 [Mycena sp. CBHHK59/15]|nr:hypothetical protein B0H10DRAFT_661460 [Mycena sp. CBHHK59/15]
MSECCVSFSFFVFLRFGGHCHVWHFLWVLSGVALIRVRLPPRSRPVDVCASAFWSGTFGVNTYTNATWSAVSLIPLPEINRMEREFLLGVDYSLFVGERVYGDWLRLLKGLVGARRACRVGGRHQEGRARRVQGQVGQGQRRRRSASPRRRWGGGSPVRPVQVKQEPVAYSVKQEEQDVAMDAYVKAEPADDYAGAGCKRRAVAAFSPPSYHPPQVRCPPAFPPLASALGSQQQQYAVRPAPTLVIPSHSSSTSTSQAASAYPSSSSSSAYPHPSASTSSSVSAYPQSSHPAANGYGVAPLPSFPLSHPSSLAHQSHSSVQQQHSQQSHSHSPLERFGALSLSNGKGTPSPERPSVPLYAGTGTSERGTQRPVGRQRRERPTSWVGPSSGGFGAASATYLQDRGRATFPYAGETYPMPGSYSRPRTPPTARYQPPAPTATYAQHSQYAPRYAEQGYGNEEQQQEVTTRYGEQEPKPYSAPQTLTARYEYDHAAAAGRGIQDLYFYTLASSPVSSSSTSSSVSSSGSSGSCSPSSNSNSYSDDEDEEEGEDEDMEAYEAEERREEERRREDERRREAERERGRAARLRVAPAYAPYQQQQQKPAQGVAFGVSSSTPFNCNANNGTTATSTTNSIHALSINTSGGTGLGGGGVRWGVQSARTSPVRWPAPPVYPTYNTLPTTTITASSSATHANTNTRSTTAAVAANAYATQQQQQQWTPPRPAYAPASQWTPPRIGVGAGGAEWTPPRMHVGGERVGGGCSSRASRTWKGGVWGACMPCRGRRLCPRTRRLRSPTHPPRRVRTRLRKLTTPRPRPRTRPRPSKRARRTLRGRNRAARSSRTRARRASAGTRMRTS